MTKQLRDGGSSLTRPPRSPTAPPPTAAGGGHWESENDAEVAREVEEAIGRLRDGLLDTAIPMLRRIWDPLQAAIKNNDRLALATYASSYRMRAAWALSEALAELHASDERRESGFATPRRDIMEEVDLNPISTPMNAISTPFQRQ